VATQPDKWDTMRVTTTGRRTGQERSVMMVRGRASEGEERSRLWDRWRQIDARLDDLAAVVILEPWADEDR